MNYYDPYFNTNDNVNYSDEFHQNFLKNIKMNAYYPDCLVDLRKMDFFLDHLGVLFQRGLPQGGPNPGQNAQPPNSPPPNFTPKQADVQTFAVDPGSIRGCMFRFTYIWLRRDAFWFFPVFVDRRSISGFR